MRHSADQETQVAIRASATTTGMLLGSVMIALALASACGGSSSGTNGSGGAGGTPGSGGTGSGGVGGAGGSAAGTGGATDASPDVSISDANADGGTETADGGDGSAGGDAADAANDLVRTNDITKVVPTLGCGTTPVPSGAGTIQTMGTKVPNCADNGNCTAWMYAREYFVYLPQPYDNTRAYPLVFQVPGCGGTATNVSSLNNSVDNTVIRIGLTPPPNEISHATNRGQSCFDDHEGDDSVEWVFYETLYDRLAGQLCFDKNRVFASSNSGGSWLANELGCKYAGDLTRPVRGVLTINGGLPFEPRYTPTCTDKPLVGMWIGDDPSPESGIYYRLALDRAMKVSGCTRDINGEAPEADDFPIGGGNPDNTCKRIRACPEVSPLTFCWIQGYLNSAHDGVVNPAFSTFLKLFSKPPLLTP